MAWTSDFLAKKFADTDVESSQYRQAARQQPADTAAFRKRQSARDRMMGLNVGNRPGGQSINPMMPGVPMGAVNPNYGGVGDKARWFTDMESARAGAGPDIEARGQALMNEALTQRYNGAPGGVGENLMRPSGPSPYESTSVNRMEALRQIGGLAGAGRAGLFDHGAGGSSLERTANDSPERTAMLDNIAAIRQREKARLADKRGNVNDPNSISGRLLARGQAKGAQRQQRMAQRMAGPSQEDMIIQAAMNGNPAALRMAGMIADGNRERGVGQDRNQTLLNIAGIENPQPSREMQRQGLMEMYGANGGEAVYGDMDEFIERGLGEGASSGAGRKPDPVGSAMFGAKLSPTQSRQLQEVAADGDAGAVFRYLQELGLSDDEVNEAANVALGSSFRSITNPGGWRNAFRTTVDEFWNNPAGARRRLDASRR